MTIYHFPPRFQEFHLEYDKLEERPHVPSTFNYNPAQQAFWLAVSPTACLPAIGPPDPIRFFHRHTLNGEDILAPVLLSEQTSSFYFFHIFVPSLPHYRYFFFFFWISHFSISLIWLVCEVDHRLDTQTQALQSVHLIEWLMFLLSLKNRLFLSPEAFKRNQILTQEVITFQDG